MSGEHAPLWLAELVAKGLECRTCGGVGVFAQSGYDFGVGKAPDTCSDCNGTGKRTWPQDQWPQMVWGWTEADPKPRLLYSATVFSSYKFAVTYIAAPPVLTYDGGGLLPWLAEVLGWLIFWSSSHGWNAEKIGAVAVVVSASTPLALIEDMLKAEGIKVPA